MNKQEIFNTVATHLLRQKERSLRDTKFSTKGCAYRGNDGMMCAVGVLIKDEYYYPELEGNTPYDVEVEVAVGNSIGRSLDKEDLELLVKLQDIHDFSTTSEWEKALKGIADKYNFLFSPEQLKETP